MITRTMGPRQNPWAADLEHQLRALKAQGATEEELAELVRLSLIERIERQHNIEDGEPPLIV